MAMEWRILFLGAVGAGKTAAIRTISDIEVMHTEAEATDATARSKPLTTVAMDVGLMRLGQDGQVILYGAPGQERFSFMWEILLDQTQGVVILVNHAEPEPLAALGYYLAALRRLRSVLPAPLVVGVTHTDKRPHTDLDAYRHYLHDMAPDLGGRRIPVFRTDARNPRDVRNCLIALTAMLEFDDSTRQRLH